MKTKNYAVKDAAKVVRDRNLNLYGSELTDRELQQRASRVAAIANRTGLNPVTVARELDA